MCVREGGVLERCEGCGGNGLRSRVCVGIFKMCVGDGGSFRGGIVFYIGLRG